MKLFLFTNKTQGILQLPNEIGVDTTFAPGESVPCLEYFNIYKKYLENKGPCNKQGILIEKKETPVKTSTIQENQDIKVGAQAEIKEVEVSDKVEAPKERFTVISEKAEEAPRRPVAKRGRPKKDN